MDKRVLRTLDAVKHSAFRSRFALSGKDRTYILTKGLDVINAHALDFVLARLAPAFPEKDGKQTPMRGHPVFVAQHATATCCRKCLQKWHGIDKGRPLNEKETAFVVALIMAWIKEQLNPSTPEETGYRQDTLKRPG